MPNKVEAIFIPQENINERGELAFKTNTGMSVKFDQSAAEIISKFAGDKEVSIQIETIDVAALEIPEAQREVIKAAEEQGAVILDLKLVDIAGEKVVFSDSEGGKVTVEVPYEVPEDIDVPVVYYISDDGIIYEMPTVYDPITKMISFTTRHFSYYMVAETGMATAEEEPPMTTAPAETTAPSETMTTETTTETTETPETTPTTATTETTAVTETMETTTATETSQTTETTPTVPTKAVGDPNGDGEITAEDASIILMYAAAQGAGMTYEYESFDTSCADTDGNGNVDAVDASNVLIYAAFVGAEGSANWDDVLGKNN